MIVLYVFHDFYSITLNIWRCKVTVEKYTIVDNNELKIVNVRFTSRIEFFFEKAKLY